MSAASISAQETSVMPVSLGDALPPAAIAGLDMRPSHPLEFSHAWLGKADAVRRSRLALEAVGQLEGLSPPELARRGAALTGELRVPVIAVRYDDVAAPFPVQELADRLFGPSRGDSLSLSDYWREVSGGLLGVEGMVTSWVRLGKPARHYLARDEYGWGRFGRIADLRRSALEAVDGSVDFSYFDNDGPDGVPDSGDDDGFVDFVAFFYATDCARDAREGAIWPHRGAMQTFQTDDAAADGGRIRISDYVILPAQEPGGCGPADVGVLAHETAHAFGLPDLYDYDGSSRGIGSWGLMGTGSHASPHSPAHPSAWVKEQLGWVQVDRLELADTVTVPPVQRSARVFRYDLDDGSGRYLLLEHRAALGSDRDLPGHGLLVWSIDPDRGELGMWNGDERRPAVGLLAADRGGGLVAVDGHDASAPYTALAAGPPGEDEYPVRVTARTEGEAIRATVLPPDGRRWSERELRVAAVVGGAAASRSVELRSNGRIEGWLARAQASWIRLARRGEKVRLETDPVGLAPGTYTDTLELVDELTGRVSDRLTVRLDIASPLAPAVVATELPWSWGLAALDGRLIQAGYGRDPLGLRPRPRLLELQTGDVFPRTFSRIPAEALYSPVAGPDGAAFVLAQALGRNYVYRVDSDGSAAVVAADIGDEPAYGLAVLPDRSLLVAGWAGRIRRVDPAGEVSKWANIGRPIYQITADARGTVSVALLSGQVIQIDASGTRTLETGFDRGQLVAITASADGRLFAAERGGKGRIIELGPLGPRVLTEVPGGAFYGLATDGVFLYALDLGNRQMLRLPIVGPGSRVLAANPTPHPIPGPGAVGGMR